MPWSVGDVEKHRKGLTPEQKKKWVSIANGVYKDCMKTGTDKTCAPKAIRIANSKFGEEEQMALNSSGYSHAKSLISSGKVNKSSSWSISDAERKKLSDNMFLGAGRKYPYGKGDSVYRSGVIAAEQRAAQQGETAIASAAKTLLGMIDGKQKQFEVRKFNSQNFQLVDPEAVVTFKDDGNGGGNAHIIAYSGKDIPHFWWGKLALDLQGMTHKKTIPILEQHDLAKKIGFTNKPVITPDFQLTHENVSFVDTPFSQEFQSLSKQGFPYEASVYAKPSTIEEVMEGNTVEVNGRKFTGPGSIFRNWELKETSVCVFGADKHTKAKAFSEDEELEVTVFSESAEVNIETKEEVKSMDLEKLKEENPEEYQKLMDEAKKEVEAKIKEETKKEVEGQFKETITALQASLTSAEERILKFEKAEIIRHERELKLEAENIWTKLLSESDIPSKFHEKVKVQVNYTKFVKEDSLDVEAFKAAILKEFEDWKDVGSSTSVTGFGANGKTVEDEDGEVKADQTFVDKMLQKAGQKRAA